MAYKNSFDEDAEIELRFLVEVVGEERDEVDARSRHVIEIGSSLPRYVLHKDYFPQRQTPLEFRAEKETAGRVKKISEKKRQTLTKVLRNLHSGVLSLVTTEQPLDEQESARIPSFLKKICHTGAYQVVYHTNNQIVVHMDSKQTFTMAGDKIVENCGLDIIPNKRIMCLEALENVPNYFLEMSTPSSSSEEIQCQLSKALVTFCGGFKYLRLHTNDPPNHPPEQQPGFPSVCLTLMFSMSAQVNARKLETILSSDQCSWRLCQSPETVSAPNEQLFALRSHAGPLLGLKSGCPFPGVRISVTFSQDLEGMEKFYEIVTGVHAVPREDHKTGTSYRIYPIARNFELQLVYNSAVQVENMENVQLFIRIANQQSIAAGLQQPLTSVGSGHWETLDPVGTRVVLFTVVE